jgi:cytoplasmic iron level regulating protein YaaA (DUF328/UPF0246 family)
MAFQILFSPTKNMRVAFAQNQQAMTTPRFMSQASTLHKRLKSLSKPSLQKAMRLSDNLFDTFKERLHVWGIDRSVPALYCYDGEAFRGINPEGLTHQALQRAQDRLVILSGLYGMLRPFDGINAYRLEMQTAISVGRHKNLYQFWGRQLADELKDGASTLLNLASEEYSKAIVPYWEPTGVVSPSFVERDGDKTKMVMMYAKQARGKMVRFVLENNLEELEDIKAFSEGGYRFSSQHSEGNRWVFIR